jgi:uncharacterized MnhB-related membrane protein
MLVLYICLVFGAMACAVLAIRATRLLVASLWLAALSALLSVLFYVMGAPRIAVIELSVGVGLVTVLFVFAISIAGEETVDRDALVPRSLAGGLGLLSFLLLSWLTLPLIGVQAPTSEPSLASLLWEGRALDIWLQVVLIFVSVLGVLGLLSGVESASAVERATPSPQPDPQSNSMSVQEEGHA